MSRLFLYSQKLANASAVTQSYILGTSRCIHTSQQCLKNIRAGKKKITRQRNQPLTYEETQPPEKIGVRKAWNSWNTSNLFGEERKSETVVEDAFIRQFMFGTWHNLFASEVIIKRRHNMIIIAGLVTRQETATKVMFLIGYTEELLSCFLKCPVKVEIQTVASKSDMIFKYI